MDILKTLVTDVLGNPAIMLGIVALLGLLVQKKSGPDILLGTVKTMLGFEILAGGAGMITGALAPLTKMIYAVLHVQGVVPLYWPVYSATMVKFGTQVAFVFMIGFLLNLILAKFTPLKFLALTVHLQLFWAGFIVVVLDAVGITGATLLIVGGLISGVYYWLVTAICFHYIKPLTTEHSNFVPSVIGVVIAGELGKLFGKKFKSTEDIKLPDSLEWVKDTIVTISITMFVIYLIFGLLAGIPAMNEMSGGTFWPVWLLVTSLTFGGAVAVILYGVRMMLAEIIPAFVGIQEKFLPDAKLGLDYPTIYPYAGTAVLLGFVFHLLGSIVATLVMAAIGFSPFVVPGVQINFFEGALVGVYANAHGGIKNVILSTFIVGFILQFGVGLVFPHTGSMMATGYAYEAIDFNTIGLGLVKILALFKGG